ncbi:MAG: TonB-dependent receptor domain-containing protein, partial [Pseudomonadales bacterium]
ECVPLDIFGINRPSEEAITYINKHLTAKTLMKQQVVSANVSTELFELPAGALGFAGGFEHREEKADFQSGGWAESGLGRSEPIKSVLGEYETDEFYGEFYAPLISEDMGIPFLDSASIEGAYRTVDNSFAGRDDTWTIGGRFAPIQDIEFRGNVTRSVRAPAVTELFLPLSGSFTFADDPCDARHVNEGPNPATRRANCISGGGSLPGIPDPDNFASTVENASVEGLTGGNLGLLNEQADSWTVGLILRPRWVENLTIAVDYVEIDIADAIESFTLTQIMASCYDQVSFPNTFCDKFRRDPNGQLPPNGAFESGFVNAGSRLFRGVTVDAAYATDLFAGGLDVTANFYIPQEDTTKVLESVDKDAGE